MKKAMIFLKLVIVLLYPFVSIAQDKVVIVPLNSKSIKKQQTLVYGRHALLAPFSQIISYTGGCTHNQTSNSTTYMPLNLPLGAKILSVKIGVYDGTTSGTYTAKIMRLEPASVSPGLGTTQISTVTGGSGSPGLVEKDLTPGYIETVENDETFELEFLTPTSFTNGFCYAQVTIELP